jgi:thioredoxin
MEELKESTFKTKVFNYEAEKEWKYEGDLPAIIDFYADWCGPCKALSPILEELSREYQGKLHIYKVDTEASPELAGAFGIKSIPSILFIPKEGEPSMATGMVPKAELKKAISSILNVQKD